MVLVLVFVFVKAYSKKKKKKKKKKNIKRTYLKQMRAKVSNKENHKTREFVLSVAANHF